MLALYGEYDWFESRDATSLIAPIVDPKDPQAAARSSRSRTHIITLLSIRSATAAFAGKDGQVNTEPAVSVVLDVAT